MVARNDGQDLSFWSLLAKHIDNERRVSLDTLIALTPIGKMPEFERIEGLGFLKELVVLREMEEMGAEGPFCL